MGSCHRKECKFYGSNSATNQFYAKANNQSFAEVTRHSAWQLAPTTIFGTRRIKRAQQQQTTTTQDNNNNNNNNNLPIARQQPTNNIQPWESTECHCCSTGAVVRLLRLIVESGSILCGNNVIWLVLRKYLGMAVGTHSGESCQGYSYLAWELKNSRLQHHVAFSLFSEQHNFSLTTNSSHYFQTTTNQHRPTMHPPPLFIWRPIYRP